MKINIICAMDEKSGIGKDNKIPWHISEDFKRFKGITSGHSIIMGRKTFESIGRPLPNRRNIVVSRNPNRIYNSGNCLFVLSLENALRWGKEFEMAKIDENKRELFIIGGGQIYSQALPFADKLYLTIVEGDYNCDTFFPDYSAFKKIISEESKESEGYRYKFLELEK